MRKEGPSGDSDSVRRLGEFGLIRRLQQAIGSSNAGVIRGIGDDTAVLQPTPGRVLLATTDAAVEGVHFRTDFSDPETLGRRILAVNLSDIASMGGLPRWALVSLALPAETPVAWVDDLYRGMVAEGAEHGAMIVGGNVARASGAIVVDLTLLGEVEPNRALYRSGAQVGDRLFVTGTLGDSAAGLAILLGQVTGLPQDRDWLVARQRRPTPRVTVGRAVARSGLATAMMDLSDGLASDLPHLAAASGIGATIWADRLPLSPALRNVAQVAGQDPLVWALRGGEDYELLIAAPGSSAAAFAGQITRETGVVLTEIGVIEAAPDLWLVWSDGRREPLGETHWHHFP